MVKRQIYYVQHPCELVLSYPIDTFLQYHERPCPFRGVHFGSDGHVLGIHAQSAASISLPEVDLPQMLQVLFDPGTSQSNPTSQIVSMTDKTESLKPPTAEVNRIPLTVANSHVINQELAITKVKRREPTSFCQLRLQALL